jgi:mono/diheme cytochrome c family protein
VTEIPEHLLRRSQERRAALGGEGGAAPAESSGASAPESAGSESTAVEAAPAAAAVAPAAAAAAAPAVIDEAPSPIMLTEQAVRRTSVPVWAMALLVLLPFWAILYAGAFGERGHEEALEPIVLGQQVYATYCASCHGGQGEGGSGPALEGDEAELTFPDEADHIQWVREGSQGKAVGTPYGDAARAGGQRTVKVGAMPGFASTLTAEEIDAVVLYEREGL